LTTSRITCASPAARTRSGSSRSSVDGLRRYDLSVRLLPDIGLLADGVRSTNDAFRDEIEAILDRILPVYLRLDRCISIPASSVTADYDWWAIAERLAGVVGEQLVEGQLTTPMT
jgi:hypothetical protein